MSLILRHSYVMILDLLRAPSYVVSTIAFPALFYAIFAIPESKTPESSNLLLASFSCFAVFGVIFLQFGVGVAQERSKSWYQYLRTLPMKPWWLVLSRFVSALFFSFLAALGIIFLALIFTEVNLSLKDYLVFIILLQTAGLAFCFMGLSLGYWTTEKSSLPIGNLIYLPLTFAGGLWKPPEILPEVIKSLSDYLPTRFYGEVMWSFVNKTAVTHKYIWGLVLYALIFSLVAYVGYLRDQNQRVN